MNNKKFLKSYLTDFSNIIKPDDQLLEKLDEISSALISTNKSGNKTLIFGNGGSAAIASHVSVDLTKNARIRCVNYNESDLITCFSNDFGYEYWVAKAIEFYGNKGDSLIAISSSGNSENMINGVHAAKKSHFNSIITMTGLKPDNHLRKLGDINLWLDSMAYNYVENTHQIWLLAIVDLIIGKREYSA